jgi:hypothetical protein
VARIGLFARGSDEREIHVIVREPLHKGVLTVDVSPYPEAIPGGHRRPVYPHQLYSNENYRNRRSPLRERTTSRRRTITARAGSAVLPVISALFRSRLTGFLCRGAACKVDAPLEN